MSCTYDRFPFIRGSAVVVSALVAAVLVALPAAPARADDIRDDSWQVKTLELAELHKITQGEGVTVAVIDTGVDANHPDLKGNVLPGVDLYDTNAKGRVDRTGHGTGMASLIAGHGHGTGGRDGVLGVAPKAKILPITVQPKNTGIIPPAGIATAIDWAVDHGAGVINVSLSSSTNSDIDRAVDRAYKKSVIVVASAGNRSQSIVVGAPASHAGAIAVTGTDRAGKLGPESLSGIDDTIDIAAPSVDIISAKPGARYSTATGVSGATALVSGAAALVRSKYPNLNAYRTFERLLWTTKDVDAPGKDPDFGWGVLDLRRALTGEPDKRGKPTASPSAEAAAPAEPRNEVEPWFAAILAWAVVLTVLGAITFVIIWVVRRVRRRRATGPAPDAAVPLAGTVAPTYPAAGRVPPGYPAANTPPPAFPPAGTVPPVYPPANWPPAAPASPDPMGPRTDQ